MVENTGMTSNVNAAPSNPAETVDAVTRARCASLSAHGISDRQIADVLLLTIEQVVAVKGTEEYITKYAEEAETAIKAQIDRDEGWDAVEQAALNSVREALKYNRDPKYALSAAALANKAERRTGQSKGPHVIDNSGQTTNVIVLNLNRNYVNKTQTDMVDVTPKVIDQPRKRSDLPSPKMVEQLLAPVLTSPKKELSELEQAFQNAGVVFDNE